MRQEGLFGDLQRRNSRNSKEQSTPKPVKAKQLHKQDFINHLLSEDLSIHRISRNYNLEDRTIKVIPIFMEILS